MITQEIFNNNLENIVKEKINNIVVAVSGGSDSMALTLLLNNWAKSNNLILTAITVDHNLRKESAKEALKVHKWLEKYNINHIVLTYNGEIPTSNIEAIAREYRYNLIFNYMKKINSKYLFIAHNQDEQKETFFLNLSRGSGVYGLCGMPTIYEKNGLLLIRPMLIFSKDEIKSYLKSQKQKWVEDPSNKDEKYKRVKIRKLKKLIDTLGLTNDRIENTIKNMERVRETIDYFVNECINNATENLDQKIIINRNILIKYPTEIILRTLAKIIQTTSNSKYPPRLESLENLYNKIINKNLNCGITLNKLKISFNKEHNIVIQQEIGRCKKLVEN